MWARIENGQGSICPDGTEVVFSAQPQGYVNISPTTTSTSAGEASAIVTAGTTAGTVHIYAAALGASAYAELALNQVYTVTVGQGTHPSIDWSPPSAMYGLVIRKEGASIGNLRWSVLGNYGGFSPPVTYGTVPDNASQLYRLGGTAPEPLEVGAAHQLGLVDAVGDTIFVDFTP